MDRIIDFINGLDTREVLFMILKAIPLSLLFVIGFLVAFNAYRNVGKKKITYVYADAKEKLRIENNEKKIRKRASVIIFWAVFLFALAIQILIKSFLGD